MTAPVLNDILGGDLMLGEVHVDGEQQGCHWWNRFATGVEIDLTREQFQHGQVVMPGRWCSGHPAPPRYRNQEYMRFHRRVMEKLGSVPRPDVSNSMRNT